MKDIFVKLRQTINIDEGDNVFEDILTAIYLSECISVKGLSRKVLLPVPIISAIKGELVKAGLVKQDNGIWLTDGGKLFVENELGYSGLNYNLYKECMMNWNVNEVFKSSFQTLHEIFNSRPDADVTIDQSKCTLKTSLERALLCLKSGSLIGKEILCVGDDDLVSVSLGFLLKMLFSGSTPAKTCIHVVDMDARFLEYIKEIAVKWDLPIVCHSHDLRVSLPESLQNLFDCFFTDPPYTIEGLRLFVSRGIDALKNKSGLPVFLSFAHKSPGFTLDIYREFIKMGLAVCEVLPRFNEYEGAEIIGNTSQMSVLRTTGRTCPVIAGDFPDPLYTGELRKTIRSYSCSICGRNYTVGAGGDFSTIGELKKDGCGTCGNSIFRLCGRQTL